MSASFQKYICLGNLTREPQTRYTPGGMAVCEFTVAINGARKEDPVYYAPVVVFGKTGEACQRYLGKGSSVMVEGRLQTDEWEDRQTGQKRSRTRVIAENVQFIGSRGETQQNAQNGANQGYSAPAPRPQAPRPAAPYPGGHQYGRDMVPSATPPAPQQPPTPPAEPEAADDIPF
jgi:single-strand DNA-binding protein